MDIRPIFSMRYINRDLRTCLDLLGLVSSIALGQLGRLCFRKFLVVSKSLNFFPQNKAISWGIQLLGLVESFHHRKMFILTALI